MGEYATIYALHKIFNVSAVLTSKQKHEFHGHFPYLSLPVIKIENTKKWTTLHRGNDYNYVALELAAAGLLGPKCFLQDDWPFEMQIFNTYRDDILREFAFSDQLILKADAILADERRLFNSTSPITFIGVHIRRGDYPKYMKSQYSTKANLSYVKYLARAIEHYRGLHDNIIFIVASDDRPHARTLFMSLNHTKVFIADGTAFEDMCLLSRCNHSIITLGSFGFWTGYFSPGTTTYPDFMSTTSREYFLSRARYERAQIENFIALPYT
uniref:L-Fucosyltransferase n=1 Tax=Hirondellea gigas TaxID=1518452 RepID=A0A6A7FW40_9CRUS